MREILFRGKRLGNGEWVYGYLFRIWDEAYILWGTTNGIPDMIKVDPSTVGQYTGLTDKNGVKIFEGDILRIGKRCDNLGTYYYPPLPYPVPVVVRWDHCSWIWETIGEKYYISFPDAWCHYTCTVIGNIYDNPKLLKGGGEG